MADFSVCVLLFGHQLQYGRRCLDSLAASCDFATRVADVRIGLNSVSATTLCFVQAWAKAVSRRRKVPVLTYRPLWNGAPALKYPLMRRMFHDAAAPLANYTMWFDDDSFLIAPAAGYFFTQIARLLLQHDVVGQLWQRRVFDKQQLWLQSRFEWGRSKAPADTWTFPQGGWWSVRSKLLSKYDWPPPELRHCGGDALFGELCRQQDLSIHKYDQGVMINAGLATPTVHSSAERRGYTEPMIAMDYTGLPLSIEHQSFELQRTVYKGGRQCSSGIH